MLEAWKNRGTEATQPTEQPDQQPTTQPKTSNIGRFKIEVE